MINEDQNDVGDNEVPRTNAKVAPDIRKRAIEAMSKGTFSVKSISEMLNVDPRTIRRYYKRFQETQSMTELPRGGNNPRRFNHLIIDLIFHND